jgi:hypothetical protein
LFLRKHPMEKNSKNCFRVLNIKLNFLKYKIKFKVLKILFLSLFRCILKIKFF